jgi:phosphoribosylformimino-5-aminoimidazole carboxamide ribotide isomerase
VRLYPAIDIQGGRAVRLRRGDFDTATVFSDDPLSLALYWEEMGAEVLHLVDLDAARTGEPVNFDLVDRIVNAVGIPVQYGGGVRNEKTLALVAGTRIRWTVIGTAAIIAGDFMGMASAWLGDRLVVGVDCDGGLVTTHGWQERSQMTALRFIKTLEKLGVKRVVYTDVTRDGMMMGPNFDELVELCEGTEVEVILSGGVSTLADLRRVGQIGAKNLIGAIIGRALYENAFTLAEAKGVLA